MPARLVAMNRARLAIHMAALTGWGAFATATAMFNRLIKRD